MSKSKELDLIISKLSKGERRKLNEASLFLFENTDLKFRQRIDKFDLFLRIKKASMILSKFAQEKIESKTKKRI